MNDLISVRVVECRSQQDDRLGVVGDVLGAAVDPGDHDVDLRSAVLLDVTADEGVELVGRVGPQRDPFPDVDAHLPPGLLVDRDLVR